MKIYIMQGRKQWDFDAPKGWREIAWERFDYVECGIFEKPDSKLTNEDRELIESYSEKPEGWIEPEVVKLKASKELTQQDTRSTKAKKRVRKNAKGQESV